MNCKAGDLARIVGSDFPLNINKLVFVKCASPDVGEWECEPLSPLVGVVGFKVSTNMEITDIPDADLRPIRDTPGQDETLTWLDVPSTDKVAA